MTLSRTRPLPSHDWPQGIDAGPPQTCETCGSTWEAEYDDPPPWKCRTKPLDRGKRMKAVSETNSGRAHQKDMELRDYVRALPCVACGAPPPSDPHHVYTWGSGYGDWRVTGYGERVGNLTPLCRAHHNELDSVGGGKETFEAEHGVDLSAEARKVGEAFLS